MFGSDVSSVFFGGLSALALADDGAFVFEKVLEAVAPLVEEAHKAGIAAAEARLKKHRRLCRLQQRGLPRSAGMSAWELPTTVEVAGRSFAIRSDFRAVLMHWLR